MVATTKDQDKLLLNVHFHSFCPFPSSPFQCRGNLCIGRPGLSSFNPPVASKGTCFRIYARIPSKRQPIDCKQVSLPLLDFQQSFLQSRGHHLEGKRVKDEASNSKQSQVLPINLDITFHLTNEITGSFLKSLLSPRLFFVHPDDPGFLQNLPPAFFFSERPRVTYENQVHILWQSLDQIAMSIPISIHR